MESELATLSATLRGIERLHAAVAHTSARPQPFTNAMLNRYELPVISYIRDADPLEAGLFCYPSSSKDALGGKDQQQQQSQQHAAVHEMTAEEQYALLNPRGPEIRPHQPPTPLRRPVPSGGKAGQDDYDARILLLAAQKLLDNYHKAPRARKHIKALQKRNAEAIHLIQDSEQALADTEAAASQRGLNIEAPAPAPLSAAPSAATSDAITNKDDAELDLRLRRRQEYELLQGELQRDDLDCFALEQLIRELHGERDVLMSPRKVARASAAGGGPPVSGTGLGGRRAGPRPSSLARAGTDGSSTTSALGTTSRRSSALSKGQPPLQPASAAPSTPVRGSALARQQRAPPVAPERATQTTSTEKEAADVTVTDVADRTATLGTPSVASGPPPAQLEQVDAEQEPASSTSTSFPMPTPTPELERISASIIASFGDAIRFAHVANPALLGGGSDQASAFTQTFEGLRALAFPQEAGGYASASVLATLPSAPSPDANRADEEDETASVLTSTTVSTSLTTSTPVEAPTPANTAIAFVLLQLLASPASSEPDAPAAHAVEFAALKARAEDWWNSEKQAWVDGRAELVRRLRSAAPTTAPNEAAALEESSLCLLRAALLSSSGKAGGAAVGSAEEAESVLKMSGEQLATSAVYSLVAKRLLRIRRAKGMAAIGFA
ncbi:hypothetical protein V8E36_001005 [Tilletia maclaganii]